MSDSGDPSMYPAASRLMQCMVLDISYDEGARTAVATIERLHDPDMTGTVEYMTGVYPGVETIHVKAGRDTVYAIREGKWVSLGRHAGP